MSAAVPWTLAPHAMGIWTFEDQSAKRLLPIELTARGEVAALLIEPHQQADRQAAGHFTPHRGRLPHAPDAQAQVRSTPELVQRLLAR